MLCNLCDGAGNLAKWFRGKIEYWTCPCCGGSGVRWTGTAPPLVGPGVKGNSARSEQDRSRNSSR